MLCDMVKVTDCNYLQDLPRNIPIECTAKFRYRQKDIPITIIRNSDDTITVTSNNKLKAVTNGQIACFYNANDELFAAGIIDSIYNEGKKVELN